MVDRECPECDAENADTVQVEKSGGRVGVYCWECLTLYVDPEIVYGDVEVRSW